MLNANNFFLQSYIDTYVSKVPKNDIFMLEPIYDSLNCLNTYFITTTFIPYTWYIYNASNSKSSSWVHLKIMWLLKSQFDSNSIMINHKPNDDFNNHVILGGTQEGLVALLII
jgi:hypothetical protein